VAELAQAGHTTGASMRNWASYGGEVELPAECADWQRAILSDPQTSGGLLVSCAADAVAAVLEVFGRHGFAQACVIGGLQAGAAKAVVSA
jgi:selenide,water dikinase